MIILCKLWTQSISTMNTICKLQTFYSNHKHHFQTTTFWKKLWTFHSNSEHSVLPISCLLNFLQTAYSGLLESAKRWDSFSVKHWNRCSFIGMVERELHSGEIDPMMVAQFFTCKRNFKLSGLCLRWGKYTRKQSPFRRAGTCKVTWNQGWTAGSTQSSMCWQFAVWKRR